MSEDESPPTSKLSGSVPGETPARLDRYRLLRKLGEGGMGEVYVAHDERLGREVALKRIRQGSRDADSSQRFWREARAAAAVNHPNVCQIFEIGEHEGEPFLTMELLSGESLGDRLERGALGLHEAVAIAQAVLAALDAVHRKGLVHRDLKPSNIFLTSTGVKLLDFGLARSFEGAPGADVTRTGQIVGTPLYMSPEQLRGEAVDARSDLFSLGAILFEMLSGRRAFAAPSAVDIFHAVLHEQPPALAGSPAVAAADRVLRRALAKKRDDRPPSAEAMAKDLRDSANPETNGAAPKVHAMTRLIVLPFRTLRPDPELDFLTVTLPDAITGSLAGLGSLLVRSTMTAARFAADAPDLRKIASDADVDLVLTGTLLRAGDKLRVTAQLVEAPSGTVVWTHGSVAPVGDVFQLEDELVRRIVGSLSVPLTAREDRLLGRDVPATPRAYELYLRANAQAMTMSGWPAARELYLGCLKEDERFAPAWARLGRIHRLLGKYEAWGPEAPVHAARAETAFRRALELNPDLPLAHNLYAAFELENGRVTDALRRLLGRAAATAADPELYTGLVAATRFAGLVDASLVADQMARRLDPGIRTSVSYTHLVRGEYQKALETNSDIVPLGLVYGLLFDGRAEAALVEMKRIRPRAEGTMVGVLESWIGLLSERSDEAMERAKVFFDTFPDPEGLLCGAVVLLAGGRREEAVDLMGRAVAGGFRCPAAFQGHVAFAPLRDDPRFLAIVKEATVGHREALAVYEACGGPRILGSPEAISDAAIPTVREPRPERPAAPTSG